MSFVKHPKIKVKLTGQDGNAFAILGRMQTALKKHKVPEEEIKVFMKEAINGDYNHLLQTCMEWVDVS